VNGTDKDTITIARPSPSPSEPTLSVYALRGGDVVGQIPNVAPSMLDTYVSIMAFSHKGARIAIGGDTIGVRFLSRHDRRACVARARRGTPRPRVRKGKRG
jgi:hypothetical protein